MALAALEARSRSLDLPRPGSPLNPSALISPTVAEAPKVSDMPNGHIGLRVLVADDNATNLEVLTRMLLLEKVNNVEVAMVSGHNFRSRSSTRLIPVGSIMLLTVKRRMARTHTRK